MVESVSLTCDWNKLWFPSSDLPICDWVACLRPPDPPTWSDLWATQWSGQPVQFGETVKYVCDRNMFFEDDQTLDFLEYTCQNGSQPNTKKGYFDVSSEDNWPVCTDGKEFYFILFL